MRICSGAGCLRAVPDNARFCDECKPKQQADAIKAQTGSADGRRYAFLYKSKRWQDTRSHVIRRSPFCEMCRRQLSTVADHIIPSGVAIQQARESGRFHLDAYAGFFLTNNLQGLCRDCHARKTRYDKQHIGEWPSVFDVDGMTAEDKLYARGCVWFDGGTTLKTLARRSNTTVVCGPPGSGKTTYVKARLLPGDVYFDYDEVMARVTGLPLHQLDRRARPVVLLERDQFVLSTAENTGHVWIIVTERESRIVALLEQAGADVVEMNTSRAECARRLKEWAKANPQTLMVEHPAIIVHRAEAQLIETKREDAQEQAGQQARPPRRWVF